jgi:hypothetical protein
LFPYSLGGRREKIRGEERKKAEEKNRWFVREKRRRPIEVKRRQKEDVTVTIFFLDFLSSLLCFVPSPGKLLAASTTGTFFVLFQKYLPTYMLNLKRPEPFPGGGPSSLLPLSEICVPMVVPDAPEKPK